METRLRRPQWDAKRECHLGQWQIEVVVQHDQRPLVVFEAAKAAFELVTVGGRRGNVDDRFDIQLGQLDVEAMTSKPSALVETGPNEEPVEPGIEPIRVPQRGQITPGADERILHGVLGLFGVPEDQASGGIEAIDRGACQRGKGVMIAPSRSLHEFSLHVAPLGGTIAVVVLAEYGEGYGANRSDSPKPVRATIAVHPRPAKEPSDRVKIHEADAKELLVGQGLPVPPWAVAHTPAEARDAAQRFLTSGAERVVIKAQVLVGGRGKAGGVKLAGTPTEAEAVASAILGMDIKGMTVRKVLVGPAADIVKEYYLSAVLDRSARRILVMGSAEGGVEIEQVAAEHPGAIQTLHADARLGLLDHQARKIAFALDLGPHWKAGAAIAKGLVRTMLAIDADLVEINPLAVVRERGDDRQPIERLVCLDAKVTLDDSALPRRRASPSHRGRRDARWAVRRCHARGRRPAD